MKPNEKIHDMPYMDPGTKVKELPGLRDTARKDSTVASFLPKGFGDISQSNQDIAPKSKNKRLGKKIGSVAAVALIAGGAFALKSNSDSPERVTSEYTVQTGDTAWGIATQVEYNVDKIEGNSPKEPIIDDILNQAGADGLQPGEKIQLDARADIQPIDEIPGVQLTLK